jgi:hypothetical protein
MSHGGTSLRAARPDPRPGHVDVLPLPGSELRDAGGRLLEEHRRKPPRLREPPEHRKEVLDARRVRLLDVDVRQLDRLVPGRVRVDLGEVEQLGEHLPVLLDGAGRERAVELGDPFLYLGRPYLARDSVAERRNDLRAQRELEERDPSLAHVEP